MLPGGSNPYTASKIAQTTQKTKQVDSPEIPLTSCFQASFGRVASGYSSEILRMVPRRCLKVGLQLVSNISTIFGALDPLGGWYMTRIHVGPLDEFPGRSTGGVFVGYLVFCTSKGRVPGKPFLNPKLTCLTMAFFL